MLLLAGQPGLLDAAEDKRSGTRRRLRLQSVGFTAAQTSAPVLIHDLSQTGILLESSAAMTVGEAIHLELPHGETGEARVVWASDGLYGCQFERPLSRAAVSAALLKAPASPFEVEPSATVSKQASEVAEPRTDKLSARARIAVIGVLALVAWSPVALAISLLAR